MNLKKIGKKRGRSKAIGPCIFLGVDEVSIEFTADGMINGYRQQSLNPL